MNGVDAVLIAVVVLAVAHGAAVGAVRAGTAAAGVLLGGIVGWQVAAPLGRAAALLLPLGPRLALALAGTVVFLVIVAAFHVIGALVERLVSALLLSWLDHVAGALVGLAEAGLVVALVATVTIVEPLPGGWQRAVEGSALMRLARPYMERLVRSAPRRRSPLVPFPNAPGRDARPATDAVVRVTA